METFPLLTAEGAVWAFEVEIAIASPRVVARLLAGVNEVDDVRPRRAFGEFNEVHVRFRYRGRQFVVSEPFGDSSRLWIGPCDKNENLIDASPLEDALRVYRPPLWRLVLAELLTLRFLFRLARRLWGR